MPFDCFTIEKVWPSSITIHPNAAAAATKPDDAGGLLPVLFIAAGARVMLTSNVWQEVGLCNGAAGMVYELLYQEGQAPPHLTIAVLVQFVNYCGPAFISEHPKCVPIAPLTLEWESGRQRLSQQQLPLSPCCAITIHKSQGQTLDKAVTDLGRTEISAGCTFVAISRLRKIHDGLFQPMTFERLQAIGRTKRLIERKNGRSTTSTTSFTDGSVPQQSY